MTIIHRCIFSSLLLAASVGCWAQNDQLKTPPEFKPPVDQRMEPGWHQRGQHMAHRFEKRIGVFKSKLALRPDQESAWNNFVQAVRPMPSDQPMDRAKLQSLTTPERLDVLQRMMPVMQERMQARAKATLNFYGALSDEQKRTFDHETGRWMAQHPWQPEQ